MNIDDEEEERKSFMNFVDRLVFYRDIASIKRFRLQCHGSYIDPQRVGVWICTLAWHKIEELDLWTYCLVFEGLPLPQGLFSSQTLVVLKLNLRWKSHELKLPEKIRLPRLKVLHFKEILFPNDGSEERLFLSCPILEELVLSGCDFSKGCIKFDVSNQNLKQLTLEHIGIRGERRVDIVINAPSLVHLNYYISRDYSLVLIDAKSLAEVTLHPGSDWPGEDEYCIGVPDVLRETQNIQTLQISFFIFRDIQGNNAPIPLLDKMTCLKIFEWEYQFDPISLEYFLARCVVLETLIMEECTLLWPFQDKTRNQHSLQRSQLAPLLRHLKIIEIKSFRTSHVEVFMAVIAFFLENAMVLEELKIYSTLKHRKLQAEIMKKIAILPRASNKCRLLF